MRKILATAVLACLAIGAAAPQAAFADSDETVQVGKNVFLSFGLKTWINTWQTNLTGNSGKNWTMLTAGPRMGVIPSASLKLKRFLVSGSFMVTPDYRFPRETFYTTGAGSQLYSLDITGSRREYDLNFGFYVSRSVVLTMGYKGISEKFRVENSRTGTSENKVYLNGVTLGIAGSAPIGKGFSVYGSGAGGWMGVTYDPSSQYTDNGLYEASEMGLAWKAPGRVPLSVSLGYKFQLIQTRINSRNSTNYESLPRNEVTRGPMLGLNLVF
ncbi:MAG TPA: hypothetical protein DD417_11895 [Elusimicrobia bacterium]|nr:hypothetical protein [Elusimicrobiota bacterium]